MSLITNGQRSLSSKQTSAPNSLKINSIKLDNSSNMNKEMEVALSSVVNETEFLASSLVQSRTKLREMATEREKLIETLKKSDFHLQQKINEYSALEKEASQMRKEIMNLEEKTQKQEIEIKNLQTKIKQNNEINKAQSDQKQSNETENEELRAKLNTFETYLTSLGITDVKKETDSLVTKRDGDVFSYCAELERRLFELQTHCESLENDNTRLRETNELKEQQLTQQQSQATILSDSLQKVEEAIRSTNLDLIQELESKNIEVENLSRLLFLSKPFQDSLKLKNDDETENINFQLLDQYTEREKSNNEQTSNQSILKQTFPSKNRDVNNYKNFNMKEIKSIGPMNYVNDSQLKAMVNEDKNNLIIEVEHTLNEIKKMAKSFTNDNNENLIFTKLLESLKSVEGQIITSFNSITEHCIDGTSKLNNYKVNEFNNDHEFLESLGIKEENDMKNEPNSNSLGSILIKTIKAVSDKTTNQLEKIEQFNKSMKEYIKILNDSHAKHSAKDEKVETTINNEFLNIIGNFTSITKDFKKQSQIEVIKNPIIRPLLEKITQQADTIKQLSNNALNFSTNAELFAKTLSEKEEQLKNNKLKYEQKISELQEDIEKIKMDYIKEKQKLIQDYSNEIEKLKTNFNQAKKDHDLQMESILEEKLSLTKLYKETCSQTVFFQTECEKLRKEIEEHNKNQEIIKSYELSESKDNYKKANYLTEQSFSDNSNTDSENDIYNSNIYKNINRVNREVSDDKEQKDSESYKGNMYGNYIEKICANLITETVEIRNFFKNIMPIAEKQTKITDDLGKHLHTTKDKFKIVLEHLNTAVLSTKELFEQIVNETVIVTKKANETISKEMMVACSQIGTAITTAAEIGEKVKATLTKSEQNRKILEKQQNEALDALKLLTEGIRERLLEEKKDSQTTVIRLEKIAVEMKTLANTLETNFGKLQLSVENERTTISNIKNTNTLKLMNDLNTLEAQNITLQNKNKILNKNILELRRVHTQVSDSDAKVKQKLRKEIAEMKAKINK